MVNASTATAVGDAILKIDPNQPHMQAYRDTLSDYDQEGGAELLGRLYMAMVREMSPPT